jgi:CrcB protein
VSAAVLIGIGLLGGAGALGRFLLDGFVSGRAGDRFPWGTLAVNLSGAFALGMLAGATVGGDARRLVATGLLGAFTTFSTWMFESHRLAEDGEGRRSLVNLLASLVLGLGAAWLGREIGGGL